MTEADGLTLPFVLGAGLPEAAVRVETGVMRRDERFERAVRDALLALDEEARPRRHAARRRGERFDRVHASEERALVVGRTARVELASLDRARERTAFARDLAHRVRVIGDVVMVEEEHRAIAAADLREHVWVATLRGDRLDLVAEPAKRGDEPSLRSAHRRRIAADARDPAEVRDFSEVAVEAPVDVRVHGRQIDPAHVPLQVATFPRAERQPRRA